MRKFGVIVLVSLFAIFAVADILHELIANDAVHYFSKQPHQLLVVAAIGIVGGLVVLIFFRLSPHRQRRVKLFTLGAAATFVTVCGVYFGYQIARLSVFSSCTLALVFLCVGVIATLLWFEFYQIFRSSVS